MGKRVWQCDTCGGTSDTEPWDCPACDKETCDKCFDMFATCKPCCMGKTEESIRLAANAKGYEFDKLEIPEDTLSVVCGSCGHHYSLHVATVCPECFAWPKAPGPIAPPPYTGPKGYA
jgi:hypothetical protein